MRRSKKLEALAKLASKRKQDDRSEYKRDYLDVSEIFPELTVWDDFVSPWTLGANAVDSDLMLVAQDWSSEDSLKKAEIAELCEFGRTPSLPTNKRIDSLLEEFFGRTFSSTFGTNLFPFIKQGSISSAIPMNDLMIAAREYCIPQIEIVEPRTVLVFGSGAFNALRRISGLSRTKLKDIGTEFQIGKATVVGLPHPGGMGTANAGGEVEVKKLWELAGRIHCRKG